MTGKHGPCPLCGEGRDRWRWDNRDDNGGAICGKCGSFSGIGLVMAKTGLPFKEACAEVAKIVSAAPVDKPKPQRSAEQKRASLKQVWDASLPVSLDNPAGEYLYRRCGLTRFPPSLRFMPEMAYKRDDGSKSFFPALVARVTAFDGSAVNIMRVYLRAGGTKSDVPDPKRTMEGSLPAGCAVRLALAGPTIGIAEGIETALSAQMMFGIPVWAALNDGRLAAWRPPEGTEHVVVFGDQDHSFAGQAAAYALGKRLRTDKMSVEVRLPGEDGLDFNDLHQRLRMERAA
jgi:putative DNA primase/helicase